MPCVINGSCSYSGLSVRQALGSEEPRQEVLACGWVRTRRDSKGFFFLEINDGSCLGNLQILVDGNCENTHILRGSEGSPLLPLDDAQTGASVAVLGDLVPSLGKGQKWELKARRMQVAGGADQQEYPLQKKRHSDEFLRGIAHLRPRTNKYGATFRIRSETAFAVHEYFRQQGFYYVHTPILTGSDCEGAGEMFRVTTLPPASGPKAGAQGTPDLHAYYEEDFFGRECNLTVSGQLEAEAMAMALGKVYTFGPTFRAENSNTPRHAAEFWMIEPEMAFADLTDLMDLGEGLTRHVVRAVLERCPDDLGLFNNFVDNTLLERLDRIAGKEFARISYGEAIEILQRSKHKFEYPAAFGLDLQTEHERYLSEEYVGGPVAVYNYPKEIKAFYMRQNPDGRTVAAMDILVPRVGELVGGSQREERRELLEARLAELGQPLENYWWYLDLRRFGSVPHAGFGLGFERLLMLLTGISNIRDVIPFPRTPKSLEF